MLSPVLDFQADIKEHERNVITFKMVFFNKDWKTFLWEVSLLCWITRFSLGLWLIFTLTDMSFRYSSEKNEQAHVSGKKSQIKGSKTGLGSFYGKQTFPWVSWYFCWNVLVFSLKKRKVSLSSSPNPICFCFLAIKESLFNLLNSQESHIFQS